MESKKETFAYVPVTASKKDTWTIGAAMENKKGYKQTTCGIYEVYRDAEEFCELMNKRMGLTPDRAAEIIRSTMQE